MRTNMKKLVKAGQRCLALAAAASAATIISGCTAGKITESASGKNLGMDGYVMYGTIEI